MADQKITEMTEKTVIGLSDLLTIVDMSATPVNKKMTVANFLVSLRIRQGETNSINATKETPSAVVFSSALGTDTDGKDYDLVISCYDSAEHKEQIGYEITDRSENGFTITPIEDAYIEFTAILK